jgi:hypothetical protein
MVENHVQITQLTRHKHFISNTTFHMPVQDNRLPADTVQTPPKMVLHCEGLHLHPRLKLRSNEWPQKLRDFPWAFYQNCTWKTGRGEGVVPLTSSPSLPFLITPVSTKETTHEEFILVALIKTQTAIVLTVTKWILQAGHTLSTATQPQHRYPGENDYD